MAAAANAASGPTALDRAEVEVNRVLEQIGRVFAATKTGNRGSALAVATRLKQVLPLSTANYHNALDELDQQLQTAKLIMRRDLGLLTQTSENKPGQEFLTAKDGDNQEVKLKAADEVPDNDEAMHDVQVDNLDGTTDGASPGQTASHQSNELAAARPRNQPDVQHSLKLTTNDDNDVTSATVDAEAADKAPDTAFSTNADMDSLFNDPISNGAGDGDSGNADDLIDFGDSGNNAEEFDFGVFDPVPDRGNEDSDLQAMDLGIQGLDGGNAQEEPDFNALFGDVGGQTGAAADAEEDIFNFDQLMDMGIDPGAGENQDESFPAHVP